MGTVSKSNAEDRLDSLHEFGGHDDVAGLETTGLIHMSEWAAGGARNRCPNQSLNLILAEHADDLDQVDDCLSLSQVLFSRDANCESGVM